MQNHANDRVGNSPAESASTERLAVAMRIERLKETIAALRRLKRLDEIDEVQAQLAEARAKYRKLGTP